MVCKHTLQGKRTMYEGEVVGGRGVGLIPGGGMEEVNLPGRDTKVL